MKNFSLKTKENYLPSSRRKTILRYLIVVLVAFAALGFGKNMLGTFSSYLTTPIFMARHYIMNSTATVPTFIRSRIELLTQVRSLEEEIMAQKGMDTTLALLTEENKELRALLSATSSPRIVSGVISRPPYTPYDTILIDRGSRDGITENAPVYHSGGIAIGYVRSVFPGSALVTLFSSPGAESTVYVFGPNLFTTAYGEGGGVIRISVPQGVTIEQGDTIVLPSLDSGALGTVDEIRSVPTEPEQHAYATLSVPIQSLRLVSVGARPIESITYEEAVVRVGELEHELFTFDIPELATSTPGIATTSPVEVTDATSTGTTTSE